MPTLSLCGEGGKEESLEAENKEVRFGGKEGLGDKAEGDKVRPCDCATGAHPDLNGHLTQADCFYLHRAPSLPRKDTAH